MTYREFYEMVKVGGSVTEEMEKFAMECIEKLDKKNATRRSSESKTEKENKPLRAEILAFLKENMEKVFITADIAKQFGHSSQKASSLLRRLVSDGLIEQTDVKVKGKGTVKGYFAVASEEEE